MISTREEITYPVPFVLWYHQPTSCESRQQEKKREPYNKRFGVHLTADSTTLPAGKPSNQYESVFLNFLVAVASARTNPDHWRSIVCAVQHHGLIDDEAEDLGIHGTENVEGW
jgi:hypothetical protein